MGIEERAAMKNLRMRMTLVVLSLLLLLCGCAPAIPDGVSPPTTPSDAAATDEAGVWAQTDVFTTWAEEETPGITRSGTPISVPDSVMQMMPLVEFLLDYRTAYDFQNDDLKFFEDFIGTNQHTIGNEAYLWGLMAHLFCEYGDKHPAVKAAEGGAFPQVPEAAARDFLEACFADCTVDFPLPTAAPERFVKKPIGYNGTDPGNFMTFQNGIYVCDAAECNELTGSRQQYIITRFAAWDASTYDLDIVKLFGPDGYDVAMYRVALSANDAPNALGLAWRVSKIVRIDTSDLWAGQTETGG